MATIGRRAYAEMYGPTVGDRLRLADTDLVLVWGEGFVFSQLPHWMQVFASFFPLKWLTQGMRSVFLPESAEALEVAGSWELPMAAAMLTIWCIIGLVLALMLMNLPIIVWMLYTYFREIPGEILEAARMDGAGLREEILYVLTPMAVPGIASTALSMLPCAVIMIIDPNGIAKALGAALAEHFGVTVEFIDIDNPV